MSLLSPNEVTQLIHEILPCFGTEKVSLEESAGRYLAEPIFAERDFPPFDRSMMDGYAVSLKQLYSDFDYVVKRSLYAGENDSGFEYDEESLLGISTGAKVPAWADAVVPFESTNSSGKGVRIVDTDSIEQGNFIHRRGSEASAGDLLLKEGVLIGSKEMGVLASCGVSWVPVVKWPRIGILATGNELVELSEIPKPFQIRRSNDYAIAAVFRKRGIPYHISPPLPDDEERGLELLKKVIHANEIILTCGGISKGKKDFLPAWFEGLGFKKVFQGVQQKPGKPLGAWARSGQLIIALPGNPLSVMVSLHRYVMPAILNRASGGFDHEGRQVSVNLKGLDRSPLTRFIPVKLVPVPVLKWVNNSGDFINILNSDGFIEVSPQEEGFVGDCQCPFFSWE